MKKLILILSVLICAVSFAQVETSLPRSYSEPQFYFNALNFAGDLSENESRVDLYVQVPYEFLQFTKGDNYYSAKYEVTVSIFTPKGKLVTEKGWTHEVKTNNFNETISRAYWDVSSSFIKLPLGDYKISVQVIDLDTKRGFRKEGFVTVRNFTKNPITMSDIMMVSSVKIENETKTIIPNISKTITSTNQNFYLFFEVYNNTDKDDSINITYKINRIKKKKKIESINVYSGGATEFVKPGKNSIIVEVKNPNLGFGDYVIFVEARLKSNSDNYSIAQTPFLVRWHEFPELISDLDKAIEQLVYIAKPEEINYIKSAQDEAEKERRFLEFWRKKDPTPNTLKNELMEEYYGRVKYANEHFSHYIEGWKTDMGMVYIIFGPPSSVDRHPFDIDSKPYEIWYYYEINRRFIFLDETGFGDYRLITPLWDEWTKNIWR
ncbi:GWxTD domain-containing protein [Candidatus Thermokryptus mobilis]|uniref:GWxTD domain-containing protein n=1 Tax=Candidatus Thermokryptus mobilis TaxID=1643428 RepID=A0A0S4N1G5_9BACT|nr:GWxTD domain-containing protein [Candidatus Thermokryptus mobilis]CUU04571.1 GWxTD domain-containing protein [Candidatus Thermokryptus mobilis]